MSEVPKTVGLYDGSDDPFSKIVSVLLTHPPTQDFLHAYSLGHSVDLGNVQLGHELQVTAQEIAALLEFAEYHEDEIKRIASDIEMRLKHYEEFPRDDSKTTKLGLIRSMLERVPLYMPTDDFADEFEGKVRQAENLDETTIGHLLELYKQGAADAIIYHQEMAAYKREAYDKLMSGEAASY